MMNTTFGTVGVGCRSTDAHTLPPSPSLPSPPLPSLPLPSPPATQRPASSQLSPDAQCSLALLAVHSALHSSSSPQNSPGAHGTASEQALPQPSRASVLQGPFWV